MTRGDVALALIPYIDGTGGKRRPVLIVQSDHFNAKLPDTIVAAISTNLRNVGEPNQFLIDPATPEGAASGLVQPSAIRCDRLFTIDQRTLGRTIGHLPAATMARIDACLEAALGLP
jgi:mRNA interferase MazF